MSVEVIIVPPEVSTEGYILVRQKPKFAHLFDDGRWGQFGEDGEYMQFQTSTEAIQWAEAHPRFWTVLNRDIINPFR